MNRRDGTYNNGMCRAWHGAVWNSPRGLCGREAAAVKTHSGPEPDEGGAYLTRLFQKKLTKVVAQCKGERENVISVQISDLNRISSRPKHNASTKWFFLCVCVCFPST